MTPRGGARMDPRGMVGRIYKEDHYTSLWELMSKSMGANDPQGRAIFDPRGMIGRIYIEDH